uniref:Small integral membrane protein 34B n=2 Tax=Steinernema glaseri TaxID=37863 RepID=A0A1I7Y5T6_9BILA
MEYSRLPYIAAHITSILSPIHRCPSAGRVPRKRAFHEVSTCCGEAFREDHAILLRGRLPIAGCTVNTLFVGKLLFAREAKWQRPLRRKRQMSAAVLSERIERELSSLAYPEKVDASWAFTIFVIACFSIVWMLYMTGHVYEVYVRSTEHSESTDHDREEPSYGNRVDDFYADLLEDLYDHLGM